MAVSFNETIASGLKPAAPTSGNKKPERCPDLRGRGQTKIKQAAADTSAHAGEGNTEFLRRGIGFGKIKENSLAELKRHLQEHGIDCRWEEEALSA